MLERARWVIQKIISTTWVSCFSSSKLQWKKLSVFFMLSIIYKFSKGDVKIFYLLSIKSLKSCTGLESRHNLDINHNTQACCAWLKIHTHTQKLWQKHRKEAFWLSPFKPLEGLPQEFGSHPITQTPYYFLHLPPHMYTNTLKFLSQANLSL